MSGIQIAQVVNANIYLNGKNLLGRAAEVKLPEISAAMKEHSVLGLVGKYELPAGFEKMEGEIIWNSFYPDVLQMQGDIFSAWSLQCRSSREGFNSQGRYEQAALVTFLTVHFKGTPLGEFKQHENVSLTSKFACSYVKQVVNGQEVFELDVLANIYRVGGRDLLSQYRANIGG